MPVLQERGGCRDNERRKYSSVYHGDRRARISAQKGDDVYGGGLTAEATFRKGDGLMGETSTQQIIRTLREPEIFCEGCPYYGEPNGCNMNGCGCTAWGYADEAAARLEQLESELATVKAERDAAVADIKLILIRNDTWGCRYCKHSISHENGLCVCEYNGLCRMPYTLFEWRGVQEVDHD